MKTHKDLEVWKGSMEMVKDVYMRTSIFPKSEMFGLTGQIRRAAVSVPTNISEGSARKNTKEFKHFLRISYGSLAELETLLILATDLEYLTPQNYTILFGKIKLLTVQLSNLMKALDNKIHKNETIH
jgi:four helix bundle protein